jgi:hypothetical protein
MSQLGLVQEYSLNDRERWWVIMSQQGSVQEMSLDGQRKMAGDYELAGISAEIFPWRAEKDGGWLWASRNWCRDIPQLDRERWWVIMSWQGLVQKYSPAGERKMAGDYEPAGINVEIFTWWAEKDGGWLWAARD